jgi:hypothetical protein
LIVGMTCLYTSTHSLPSWKKSVKFLSPSFVNQTQWRLGNMHRYKTQMPFARQQVKSAHIGKENSWIYFMLIYIKVQYGDGLGKIYPFHVVCNSIHFGCNNTTH